MGLAVTKQEAFWEACGYGRLYEVKGMLEAGHINVNWKSYTHDCCPIHVASQGKIEIVKLLLAANCDVNAMDDRDNLAIHHAAMKGHADIIQLLLNAGSKIDCPDKNGWTPLLNAAYWCQPEVCQKLVNNKCNVHLKNKDERTALHEACRSESTNEEGLADIVQLLVECGCDIDSKSSDVGEMQALYMADFTPLMFCAYHGHPEVAKILIDADCRINEQGSNQWSALHWAADRNNTAVVEVLLHGGIDVYLKGLRDELALDRASDNKIREMIEDAMRLNSTEHKIAMETRGTLRKHLYIPTSGAQDTYSDGLAMSPRLDVATSPLFQSMQGQMQTLSDQFKSRKTKKKVERRISQRIFEPPKPPMDEIESRGGREQTPCLESPVSEIMDSFGFMDDGEDEQEAPVVNGHMSASDSQASIHTPTSQSSGSLHHNLNHNNQSNHSVLTNGTNSSTDDVITNEATNGLVNGFPNSISMDSTRSNVSTTSKTTSNSDSLSSGGKMVNGFGKTPEGLEMFEENDIDEDGYIDDDALH